MFFKKMSYIEQIQKRTRKGAQRNAKDALRLAKYSIEKACDIGENKTSVQYELIKEEQVKYVAQYLNEQGFKTTIDNKKMFYIYLNIQW